MQTVVFSTRAFEREFLDAAVARMGRGVDLMYLETALNAQTATLAAGAPAVCLFVNDKADEAPLSLLADGGTRLLALRSAGFNHVDLEAAAALGMTVARVPAYSPHAVAEHTVGLILALNRKLHRAFLRVREHNFSLDGLMGFDLGSDGRGGAGKTVGVIGTGRIGETFARIMAGFGCRVVAFDPVPGEGVRRLGGTYVPLETLYRESDIISLHCPLTPATQYLINDDAIALMKAGVMIINTSRGAVVDTKAVIRGLKTGRIGALGLDVYEEEGDVFFRDLSERVLQDDVLARLLTFPNVMVTSHQAFFTREAMINIAETTVGNLASFARGGASALPAENIVTAAGHVA